MARLHRRGLCALLLFLLLAPRPETIRAQTPLGPYTDHEVSEASVTVWADTSGVRLTWYRKDVLRVTLLPSRSTTHDSSSSRPTPTRRT